MGHCLYNITEDAKTGIVTLDYDEDSATTLSALRSQYSALNSYYTLDGRKLSKKPTQKGIYIHQGKKVVVVP